MKQQPRLNRKQIKLELESLLQITGTITDSTTIEDDLLTLRIVIGYMQLDKKALERELTAIRKRL